MVTGADMRWFVRCGKRHLGDRCEIKALRRQCKLLQFIRCVERSDLDRVEPSDFAGFRPGPRFAVEKACRKYGYGVAPIGKLDLVLANPGNDFDFDGDFFERFPGCCFFCTLFVFDCAAGKAPAVRRLGAFGEQYFSIGTKDSGARRIKRFYGFLPRSTLPGFRMPIGSSAFFIPCMTESATGSFVFARRSRFNIPIPCSAEIEPSYFATM